MIDLSPTQQADILDSAADYITVHGHCKGAFENELGGVCMGGAINVVMTGRTDAGWGDSSVVNLVFRTVGDCLPGYNGQVFALTYASSSLMSGSHTSWLLSSLINHIGQGTYPTTFPGIACSILEVPIYWLQVSGGGLWRP